MRVVSRQPLTAILFFLGLQTATASEFTRVSDSTFGVTAFRLGLQADVRFGVKRSLFEREDSPLFQGTGLKALATLNASPAHARLGGRLTFSPLAIFDLHVHGGVDGYFGNFQTLVGYESPDAVYGSNSAIADYVAETGNRGPGSGLHLGSQAVLKAKAGPVVLLASADLTHWDIQSDVEGDWFFEREKEVLLAFGGDQSLDGNLLLLYQHDLDGGAWIRGGSFSTHRSALVSKDSLLRSGLLLSAGNDHGSHNLIVQPYLKSRSFEISDPPYVAYAYKRLR